MGWLADPWLLTAGDAEPLAAVLQVAQAVLPVDRVASAGLADLAAADLPDAGDALAQAASAAMPVAGAAWRRSATAAETPARNITATPHSRSTTRLGMPEAIPSTVRTPPSRPTIKRAVL